MNRPVNPAFQAHYVIDEVTEDKKHNLDNYIKIKMEDCFHTLFKRRSRFL